MLQRGFTAFLPSWCDGVDVKKYKERKQTGKREDVEEEDEEGVEWAEDELTHFASNLWGSI